MGFNTELLHGTKTGDPVTGATLTPVYQSSAFFQPSAEQHEKLFHNKANGFSYTRIDNPTIAAFEERMTVLEKGVASVACASGMAALSNALLNIVGAGDEIVTSNSLYGGTIDLFHDLEAFGITTRFVDASNLSNVEAAINEKTRVIFAETIGNPKLDVTDIPELAKLAHEHGIPLIIDNTVATPFLVRPIQQGADIVINSTSKYVNGNSSAISGVITDSGKFKWDTEKYPGMKTYAKFGPFAYTAKLRNGLFRNIGACMAPQTAFYNLTGMETLGLRMERACDNAMLLAATLDLLPGVTVNYPGLPSSPWHDTATRMLDGKYGAILTIRVGSKEKAFAVMNALKIPMIVSNIGDTKTLIVHPESTLSAHSTEQEKKDAAVYDDMIRISVGIEDVDDLIQDFEEALSGAGVK
ncbi:MAG: aminotransferase class I/II-fold pyridoxal phosphate-dependent enzyme [Lachnospiraceae bacterium]|nr:aminotransferase class I/II-fold pyridoxal phosphate-dependent enzyme [Agathobacter sp.]MDD6445374.1 aminotransferase class I/II-fold pyridoxal phosphate-dependent enzyme [Lachnospiraceae bacterium]MDY4893754.1 aminotransferase class I/II-fold pyridoxal phosphate-dependent enzyme [Agathobacter sp.]